MATSSGFWENIGGPGGVDGAAYGLLGKKTPNRYHLTRILRTRGMKQYSEVADKLLDDSTPATTATITISMVTAVADPTSNAQGGVRGITSQQIMDGSLVKDVGTSGANTARAVAAADVTEVQKDLIGGTYSSRSPTYPVDKSGNGGGGKAGV